MNLDIRLERQLRHPVERVWAALTDSDHLAAWLMPNDFEPRVGHRFRLTGEAVPGWRGWAECEVVEIAPYTMEWAWWASDEYIESRVRFELTPTGRQAGAVAGTRMTLTHRGPETIIISRLLSLGWAARMPALDDRLEQLGAGTLVTN